MPRKTSTASGILTSKQLRFVAAWQGDVVAAARAAGYTDPTSMAYRIMEYPAVANEIRRKQRIMTDESAKRLAGQLNFDRAHVLNRLWEIAQIPPVKTNKNLGAQVKAAQALATVFDNELKCIAELLPQLQTRTPDEIQFWIRHGHFPLPSGENHAKKTETTQE